MEKELKTITILVAEDDDDDYLLIHDALEEAKLINNLKWVKNGEDLLDYLFRRGDYTDPQKSPRPGIILLDLNMPKKDGREALKEIKSEPTLKTIPVIVLTTSKTEEDILRSYELGVNSFIRKPVEFEQFVEAVKVLGLYWFSIVELPTIED